MTTAEVAVQMAGYRSKLLGIAVIGLLRGQIIRRTAIGSG